MMKDFQKKRTRGFTLIELLLYLALSVTMIAVLAGMGVNALEENVRAEIAAETLYSAHFVFSELERVFEMTVSITSPLPGETADELVLELADASVVTIFNDNGRLMMSRESMTPVPLTSSRAFADAFSVTTMDSSLPAARVSLTLGGAPGGFGDSFSKTFTSMFMIKQLP